MDTALLLALGAAGGSLRGFIDAYNQTMEWQSARRELRKRSAGQVQELPGFRDFFDLVPDLCAAAFHTALGAGAAALFGLTGQITGPYAAVAVGMSAPALLTQLGRVQRIGELVAGPSGETPRHEISSLPNRPRRTDPSEGSTRPDEGREESA